MFMEKVKRLLSLALTGTMIFTSVNILPVRSAMAVTAAETEDVKAAEDKGYEERLTPHMGWAPWNEFEIHTSGDIFIQQMDLMKEYGLVDVGYTYFTTEETWQNGRDENGVLQVNKEKFPHGEGMAYYAEYAHSLGMKAGIYSDVGVDTCVSGRLNSPGNGQGFGYYPYENSDKYLGNCLGVGLYGHEEEDLEMLLVDWDYDFIKVDWCGGRNLGWTVDGQGGDQYNKVGEVIEKLRKEKGQDILYNVCCWQFPGAKVVNGDCDSWRTGGDLWASWDSVLQAIDNTKAIKNGKPVYEYSAPGKFNDLDMLQVGRGMTYEEDKSHFSMWCMAASPLSIGMDLSKITPETLAIFKNTEMIAVDQDPACVGASVAKTYGSAQFSDGDSQPVEVWRKDLGYKGSQTKAIALFNRANKERTITVNWEELGFDGDVTVRDLWQHQYIDVEENHTVTLPAHGTIVYKVEGEEGFGDTTITEEAEILTMDLQIEDKPAELNLTKLGNADWIYYGKDNGKDFRRKADVDPQLEFTGTFAALNNDGDYGDSCTAYSWSDGLEQKEGIAVTHGRSIGNTVGTYGQIDAVSDAREHILYVPISGYQSVNKIEVLANGKVVKEQILEPEKWKDGKQRVNKMVKVTYATDIPSKISVRWTITKEVEGRGSTGVEAAVLYVDPKQEVLPIYGSAADLTDTEVDLTSRGSLDYIQFGGINGEVAAKKAGTNLLQKYTTDDKASVKSADSAVTYKAGNSTNKKGAVLSALNSRFVVTLPPAKEMTEASLYLGVKDAKVLARALSGFGIVEEELVGVGTGSNKVLNYYYKSATPVKVILTLTGTLGNDPQMRLDAIALAENTQTIIPNPVVSQTDTNISVDARVIHQANATEAKKVAVTVYEKDGSKKTSGTADIEAGSDTITHLDVALARDFTGKMEIQVLDAFGKAIGRTFTYQLPMADLDDSGLIGHYTAKKLVKEKNAILLDVRSKEEFAASNIKGSLNIPLADLALKGKDVLDYAEIDKEDTVIVYCASGRRSQQARQILQYMGYTNTYDLRGYENWLYGASVDFTNYQEIIMPDTPIYLNLKDVAYEDVELRYSIGKDSTIDDSGLYTGPITLNRSDRIKAYVLFEDKVVYESYDDYLVFTNQLPDFEALNKLEGEYCSDLDFIVEESHESYTPDRTKVTPPEEGIKKDHNSKGEDMIINGHKFDKGIAAHAPSTVTYHIPQGMNRFVAVAGVDDTAGNRTKEYTVLFSIFIDGRLTGQIVRMTTGRFYTFDIAIPEGAKKLQLVAKKGNSSLHSGNNMFTEWGYARFLKDPDYKGNDPTGANLALEKPVIATANQDSSYSAEKAVDGKADVSMWSIAELPQAIQVDLGAVYELDTISTYWYGANSNYTYNIYLTDKPAIEAKDGKNTLKEDVVPIVAKLTGVGFGEGENLFRTNYNFLGRARGRYLTINVTGAFGSDLSALWEIEAYGTKVGESEEELADLAPLMAGYELYTVIKEAEKCVEADYTPESFRTFKEALAKAKNPTESERQSVKALKALQTALEKAMNNLKKKTTTLVEVKPDDIVTESEKEIADKLGVTTELAKEINKVAEEYQIPNDTLYITQKSITSTKSDKDIKGSSFAAIQAKAAKQNKDSIKLSWNKVKGADGYLVFSAKCGGKKYALKKNITKAKTTSYTHKGLKKNSYYKFIVVAYKKVGTAKVTLAASKTIHETVKGGRYGYIKSVSAKKSSIQLSRKKTYKLGANMKKSGKKTASHRGIKYESGNSKIASVNSKGKITAKKKGKCYVYAYAQNGVFKKVKVTVR